MSLIFHFSDLLGDYEFNVELDYDESMEELDRHSIASPKAEDGNFYSIYM